MPKFRRVTGLFRAAMPDGPDEDYTPELEALNGQVEFIPRYRGGVIAYPHLDPPEFVRPEPIQAVLQDGRVMTQVSVGEETVIQPVELMVSDDDEATQSWQWEAVFRDIRVGRWGDEVSISPLRFTVPDEPGPLDLTEVVGEKSGGTITVKGPRGEGITDLRAKNGELIVEWGADKRLVIPVPDAVPGPKGDKGADSTVPGPPGTVDLIGGSATITVSKQAGTSVRIGDVRVYYDSGWRLLPNPARFKSGRVLIRRQGDRVTLRLEEAEITGITSSTKNEYLTDSGYIPTGFRPQLYNDRPVGIFTGSYAHYQATLGILQQSRILYQRTLDTPLGEGTAKASGEMTWATDTALPSTLPGTAA